MPMTIENAVVASAVRLLHKIGGNNRFISEFLATALRWACNRRFAASFCSCSRCFFLCEIFNTYYESWMQRWKKKQIDRNRIHTLGSPSTVLPAQFLLVGVFHIVQLLWAISTRMANLREANQWENQMKTLKTPNKFKQFPLVCTWDNRQCILAISQSSLKISLSRCRTIATVAYNGIRNGDAKK